ncbi:MAG: branched-chain amino acid transaminase [Armatimonadetes bacterium]|nr:branched-chain amino acid transaminase [Armatimonadota bacterium]
MTVGTYVWMNGRVVPDIEATVSIRAHALHYGSSAFEGIRAYSTPRGPAVFCLAQHVDRLFDSCRIFRLDLPYTPTQVSDAIVDLIYRNGHQDCYIRPIVYRGAGSFNLDHRKSPLEMAIITLEWGRYLGAEAIEQGVDVMVSSWRRMAPNTFAPMAKIGGQYVNSQFVAMEAADSGFVEGIALDVYGSISEGSGENIFLIKQGVVYTPPLSTAILPGVTRMVVMTLCRDLGYQVEERQMPRESLYTADEIFFTGTAAEVTPVRSVDRIAVGKGSRGPITARLQDEFFGITSGRIPDRHGWLTYVKETKSVESVESVESIESRART